MEFACLNTIYDNSSHLGYRSLKRKGRQGDSPDIHWRRWRQASMSPVNTKTVTLTTFPFLWYCYSYAFVFSSKEFQCPPSLRIPSPLTWHCVVNWHQIINTKRVFIDASLSTRFNITLLTFNNFINTFVLMMVLRANNGQNAMMQVIF